MASVAEQFAANINLGAFSKATELKRRIWFTLGALIVYRLGTYIPLPGVNIAAFADFFTARGGGILDLINMFSGGAISRMTILALNIMPYISASIIVQLLAALVPALDQLKKEGEGGRKKLNQYTRVLTVLLATMQAWGVAMGLQSMDAGGVPVVVNSGLFFQASTVITLVGGTMFLMWLGEQITARGIGNGISLIIFAGIVAGLPHSLAAIFELGRTGTLSTFLILGIMVMAMAIIMFVVFMERAQRRVLVQYPKRQVGNRMYGGESSHLPLKLNTAGVIPPIFASSLLLLPLTIVGFSGAGAEGSGWLRTVATWLGHGQPLYMVLYAALIIFFCFFYTAIVFNPAETAENLKKYGGFVPGIRPGKTTADYFDRLLTRLTVIGAAYLAFVCLLPEFIISRFSSIPFYLGGTSLLIVVTVTMDTVTQIHSHLLAHQYEGLIRKSRLRGRKE
ncbi:MAG: preprotein translocase subunit SecY [Pseudomonadota bacterium]|nr:preprotein translocase subunit SecY [Pseudomonadota bacterium]